VKLLVNEDVDFDGYKDGKGKTYAYILDHLDVLWKDEIIHIIRTRQELKKSLAQNEDNRTLDSNTTA
jgi:hypothetical protein